jgi:hypothetical protein
MVGCTEGAPKINWEKDFVEEGKVANSGQQTSDGGYVLAGTSDGNAWLAKIDSSGNLEWQNTYGGSELEDIYEVQQITDGGYILAGMAQSFGHEYGAPLLVRTDIDGTLVWQKSYAGERQAGKTNSVAETLDGGFVFVGNIGSVEPDGIGGAFIAKTDIDGNQLWMKTYGEGMGCDFECIRNISGGSYIISGYKALKNDSFFPWIVKVDREGDLIWDRLLEELGDGFSKNIEQTSDGGYILATSCSDTQIVKIDLEGQIVWRMGYSWSETGTGGSPVSVHQISDGGYILACHVNETERSADAIVAKLNYEGKVVWKKLFKGTYLMAMAQQTSDGCYALIGNSKEEMPVGGIFPSKIWLVKLKESK